MNTPAISYQIPRDRVWAADTGCFAKPDSYRDATYLRWLLDRRPNADRCLFATAPDRWGDGKATLKWAAPVLPLIRAVGFRAALVVQPGVTERDIPWDELDAIFVGGVDEWQNGIEVQRIVDAARQRGKWTHRGRVNSFRRLRQSQLRGYDSADGTYVAFGPDVKLPNLRRWMRAIAEQPVLEGLSLDCR